MLTDWSRTARDRRSTEDTVSMNPEGRVFLGGSAAACTIRHSGAGTTIGLSVEPRYPGPGQRDIITPRMSSGRRGAPR
jgi:hypothetical protein